ncbi:ABC transporter permease [candidate division KSB1 bacterium]
MRKISPPKVASRILQSLSMYEELFDITLDLKEVFYDMAEEKGSFIAYLWFWMHTLKSLWFYLIFLFKSEAVMFKNYLKIAVRNMNKNKGFTFINITGMAIGFSCFILITLWINNELSYDRFHEKADRIYRVTSGGIVGETEIRQTMTSAILPSTLRNDFPEIEQTATLTHKYNLLCRYEDKTFYEYNVIGADSAFFDVFSFNLIKGNPKTALKNPGSIVLTEAAAIKYFGDADPLGKAITFNDALETTVTGVVENVPDNSHFHFDMLFSLSSLPGSRNTSWYSNDYITYIVLQEGYPHEQLEAKFPDFVLRYYLNGDTSWLEKGNSWEYSLQPLTDIHLRSDIEVEFEANGNAGYVYIFTTAAFIILLIACINFMNLTTAKYSIRTKEIGIRKTIGSTRKQLILQFLSESILISIIASITGLLIVLFTLPHFYSFIGKELILSDFDLLPISLVFILIVLFAGLITGSYPAFYLSSFKPNAILRGNIYRCAGKPWLRNALVVFQLSASIVLILGTFVIGRQLDFVRNTSLGFEKENVIVIKNAESLGAQKSTFKSTLEGYAGINAVSGSYSVPGTHFINYGFRPENSEGITLNMTFCEPEYLEVLNLEMIKGRFFSGDFPSDSTAIIINETAAKLLDWKDPIGKIFTSLGHSFHVIGVVKDFHYKSMHQIVRPMALLNLDLKLGWSENYITARMNTENTPETIEFIQLSWQSFSGGKPFEFSFLDDDYDDLYNNERQTGRVFLIFSFLAIIIASLGLYGLTSFIASQRTKEIGIRKVLGSSVQKITLMLMKDFLKWIFVSNVIAWPLGFFIMRKWLQNFAYRVDLEWYSFIISGIITFLVLIITVNFQVIKAARANPVDSLKYE